MKATGLFALALAGIAAVPLQALAVEPLDTFSARIGGYVSSFETDVRANGVNNQGTEVDLNRDFGLDDSATIGYVAFTWRPWEHHEFGLAYYQDDADATRTISRDITFQDTTFRANSIVSADVGIDAYEAYYTWWAASHENWALGPRVGLIWYRLDMQVALQVDVDGTVFGGARREEASVDLPALTLGGSWRWAPQQSDWRLSADAGYFKANIDNIDADVTYGRFGVEWFPWERSGFSLDYTISRVTANADRSNFRGDVHFIDSGLRLGYVYRW